MFTKLLIFLLLTTSASASYIPGTLSNPLSSYLEFTQIATPANPSAGLDRCYTKSDDKFYCLTSGGSEQLIGPASGTGTVTTVSVASANGFAGTVANPTTTPAITISTSISGVLKGNGTAVSAAVAGTDYQAPISTSSAPANQFATGFSAPNTFTYAQPAFSNLSGNITAAQMLALPSANLYVGTGGGVPAAVAMSGEASIANTGAVTLSNAAVIGKVLTGFSAGAGVVAATDTILQAFQKLVGNAAAYVGAGIVEVFTGHIVAPSNYTYILDQSAAYAYTINSVIVQTSSGTDTLALKIGGTNVTGCSAVSVSSTPATGTCTAANSVSVGNRVTLVTSADASAVDLSFTVKVTRQ